MHDQPRSASLSGRLFELVPDEIDRQISAYSEAEMELRLLEKRHRELTEDLLQAQQALLKVPDGEDAQIQKGVLDKVRLQIEVVNAQLSEVTENLISIASWLKDNSECNDIGKPHRGLVKHRHPNRDFFLADLFDYALKDDGATMEAPIFSLSTKPDLSIWEWTSKDGNKSVRVAPSVLGRATQHDKDVLIYVVSQLTEALNRGRDDAKNRTVRFTVYDFLVTTNRRTDGESYKRLHETFERLAGTRISTDIKTGGLRTREGFGIIDRWKIIEKSATDERMAAVEVTLSEWLYNAVSHFEVLTIHPDYFRLRKPLARRLYEIARKHCGHQTQWTVSLDVLQSKAGSKSTLKEFRRSLRAIETDDSLPDYRFILQDDDKVTFYVRDGARLARGLAKRIS